MAKSIKLKNDTYWDRKSIKQDIITASLIGDYTLTSEKTYFTIPLNEYCKVGNKLSLENNKIVIGSGVSKVKMSASISFNSITSGAKYLRIHNGDFTSNADTFILRWVANCGTSIQIITCSEFITDVSEGDTIALLFYSNSLDTVKSGLKYTYLTVEVVE